MRVPQVNERVKEAPASALRAMFAGIGSLLSVTDKIRPKPTAETVPETKAPAPETKAAAPKTTETPETPAMPADTAAPEDTATPEDTAAPEAASDEAAALPLANYDELSIASLRARLRNLSADQLTVLISYEKSHADRADVISMFERRITKLALGLTGTLPKLTE
jgi:cytoskeletal protein RodZ